MVNHKISYSRCDAIEYSLRVLFEDNHLLVICKPAGLATMGAEVHQTTAAKLAAEYLKRKYAKPGNVFVGVVSRLDRLVSGVLVLARTSKAASRLSDQIRRRTPRKSYLAIVEGQMPEAVDKLQWTTVEHHVLKNEAQQRMQVVERPATGSQHAELRYRVLAASAQMSLIEVELITGRKHQIRLQLSALGHPVLGDRKYDSHHPFQRSGEQDAIALHCLSMEILHPTRQEPLRFTAAPAWGNLAWGKEEQVGAGSKSQQQKYVRLPSEIVQALEKLCSNELMSRIDGVKQDWGHG